MTNWVTLSSRHHLDKGWRQVSNYLFAEGLGLAPLVAEELVHALAIMPMGFRQRLDGRFELVAIMSLDARINLFVHPDGRWLGSYCPAVFRSYPFQLQQEAGSDRHVLQFDAESGLLAPLQEGVEPFFDEEGQLVGKTRQVLEFLALCERQRMALQRAVDMLAKHSLLVPWELPLPKDRPADIVPIQGLYRVDERALGELGHDALTALSGGKALPVAYAQLFSQHRLSTLDKLYRLHASLKLDAEPPADVDALFGHGEDELSFDFDS